MKNITDAELRHIRVRSMAIRPSTSFALPAFHLILTLFCVSNIITIPDRARVPFETVLEGDGTYVGIINDSKYAEDVQKGDRLVSWRHIAIAMPQHLELLADLSSVGDRIPLTIQRQDEMIVRTVELVPFYPSYRFAVVTAVAGMAILMFGLFVYLKRPGDPTALLLHWALVALGTVTMMTQGAVESDSILSFARRSFLFIAYNMTAALFFLFTVQFPRRRLSHPISKIFALVTAFLVLAGCLSWYHIEAMQTGQAETFRRFQQLYDVFHFVFFVVLAMGIVFIFYGYTQERVPERRRALRWIYYGLLVGAAPFLLLVVLPQIWGPDLLVPEELATFFTLAIPLSFIIAFLRYHVFSIEIQHHQRLTTLLLRSSLSVLQVLFVAIILSIVWEDVLFGSHVFEMMAFGILIVILSPARSRLALLIEEAIFPARFNAARMLQDVSSRFHGLMIYEEVGPFLIDEIHTIIPRFSFLWYSWNGRTLSARRSTDPSFLPPIMLTPHVVDDIHQGRILALPDAIRGSAPSPGRPQEEWLRQQHLAFAIPLRDEADQLLGIVFGRREGGVDPLDRGEFELVQTLCLQATIILEHLHLQEGMILERRKRRELEELSRLKSHFVSSVSHDLRTPLTSVGMFLELLDKPRISARERKEYLELLNQETQRLRRLVENVLDFARAERGIKEFSEGPADLSLVLRQAAGTMAGQFKAVKAVFTVRIPSGLPTIKADADALERAFVNILSNAYKYTPQKKRVSLVARRIRTGLRVVVADNGFGIAEEELPKVFDPFYRVRDVSTSPTGGVGLGLSLVKRTIEHHGGRISIRSRRGKGTTVTVELPLTPGKG